MTSKPTDGRSFSYTQLQVFVQCPKQYEYRYIQHREPLSEGIELTLGSAVHGMLAWLYSEKEKGRVHTVTELLDGFRVAFQEEFDQKAGLIWARRPFSEYKADGEQMLELHWATFSEDTLQTLETELELEFTLRNQHRFKAVIDRLAKDPNGEHYVFDYKTGKRIPAALDQENTLQLRAYAAALMRVRGVPRVHAAYHFLRENFLRDNQRFRIVMNPTHGERTESELVARVDQIVLAKTFPAHPSPLCPWCGYEKICPERFGGGKPSGAISQAPGQSTTAKNITPTVLPAPSDVSRGIGAVIDVETTGLDHAGDEVIELAIVLFEFERATRRVLGVIDEYDGLREPSVPISRGAASVHGISPAMLRGKTLDRSRVAELLKRAEFIVAHFAAFDKGFVRKLFPLAEERRWLCSMSGINWRRHGHQSRALGRLAKDFGIASSQAHRAKADAHVTLQLLGRLSPSGDTFLFELLSGPGQGSPAGFGLSAHPAKGSPQTRAVKTPSLSVDRPPDWRPARQLAAELAEYLRRQGRPCAGDELREVTRILEDAWPEIEMELTAHPTVQAVEVEGEIFYSFVHHGNHS